MFDKISKHIKLPVNDHEVQSLKGPKCKNSLPDGNQRHVVLSLFQIIFYKIWESTLRVKRV